MVFAVEREEVMLYVEVKDPSAPVYFYINGKKVDEGEFRFEHTSSGGKHELKIKKCELGDAGCLEARTPSNKVSFPLLLIHCSIYCDLSIKMTPPLRSLSCLLYIIHYILYIIHVR